MLNFGKFKLIFLRKNDEKNLKINIIKEKEKEKTEGEKEKEKYDNIEGENKVLKSKIIELEKQNDERTLLLIYILVKAEREENIVLKSKIIELEKKNEKFLTDSRQLWEEYNLLRESNFLT